MEEAREKKSEQPVSPQEGEVTVSFLITREDFANFRAAAGKYAVQPWEFLLMRVSGAVLLLCCFFFLVLWGGGGQRFFLDALLGIAGLFLLGWQSMLPLYLRSQAGKLYDADRRHMDARTVTVGPWGLALESARYRARLPYAMLAGAYEDSCVFLFSLGPKKQHFLPKRCLTEEESIQIRNYLSSALQKKFQQEGAQRNG